MDFLTSVCTDVGIRKENNQDSFSVMKANTPNGEICIAIICDGMGGLASGEIASFHLVNKFKQWFKDDLPLILKNGDYQNIESQWNYIVQKENIAIAEYSKKHGAPMGTTLTAALFLYDRIYIIHVGDTRIYEITDSRISVLTEDQTLVAQEIRRGKMTLDEAERDPRRNVLLQCVGASKIVEPQYMEIDIKHNAVYMLCSDGFRHKITENEIHNMFMPSKLSQKDIMLSNSKKLIELNKARNETDNISVLLVKTM